MPSRLIDFGATTYQSVGSAAQLNENIASSLVDGFLNELKQFEKRPGLTSFSVLGNSKPVDALYRTQAVNSGTILAVSNGNVFKIASNGTATQFTGAALTAGQPCIFAEDGFNVFVAFGGRIARLDLTANTVALMTGGNAPTGVTHVQYLDTFLIANGTNGSPGDTFFSDDRANNYEAADSWEFYNNESKRDTCNAVLVQWNEVYAFGPDSVEISYNDGRTPFARLDGAILPYGTDAPFSIANVDNTLFYLANIDGARRVVRLEGRRPVLVSEAQDRYINTITSPSTVRGFTLVVNGKGFYALNSPADNTTIVFNLRTRAFSKFALWNGVSYDNFAGQCNVYWPEQNFFLVGDRRNNGKIHKFIGKTDDSALIRFELTSNVHRWGTHHKKESNRLILQSSASTPWKLQFGESAKALPGTLTSYTSRDDGYTYLNRLGRYRNRLYQIVHDDTATDFYVKDAEEWFTVLEH